ncbi:YPR089W [Zygosaccharomyces parabailii]|nr:YPR089W [Zygosaccharomyces parabailii]CDH13800.1 related to Dilute domain-containing protein YPR089W [Zygosaccharomyces bailii ISA1307]
MSVLDNDIWGERPEATHESDKTAQAKATLTEILSQENRDDEDPWTSLIHLIADYEPGNEQLMTFEGLLGQIGDQVNNKSRTGLALIHYVIIYDHARYVELLHRYGLNLNLLDDVVGFSPLMWGFHLNRQDCCVELFSYIDELDFSLKNKDGLSAWDIVLPESPFNEFLDQNNIFQYKNTRDSPAAIGDLASEHSMDMQMAGMSLEGSNGVSGGYGTSDGFDFDRLAKDQYFEFSDFDVPQILDLLASLPQKYPHVTTYPAALLFQCIRYADHKLESPSLVESLVHLSLTRILSNFSSDLVPNEEEATGDIVIQSYWFSAISFLYYYLCRDEGFFKRHPQILQDLINGMHSLMIELTSSIHSRMVPLMEPALLSYTTIEDVKQTMYKKDWNIFKKKKPVRHQNAGDKGKGVPFYDDEMLKHLYPPPLEEQMKLSPMKLVQIFGALAYVLELHQIHPLLRQQFLSTIINWFSATFFNKLMRDKKKKYLSRARAIQIRLNLSSLDNWIKNNDRTVPKPVLIDDFMWQRFPYTLASDLGDIDLSHPPIKNVATYKPLDTDVENTDVYDSTNSLFYYQSLHHIAQVHMAPVNQLLQWLQVATSLVNEESLDETMELLSRLTPIQLLKSMERYSYEVNEHKFKTPLRKKLSTIVKTQNSKEEPYLPERQLPVLALPTIAELTDTYTYRVDSESYLPVLSVDIQDAMYDIHEENVRLRRDEAIAREQRWEEEEDENEDEHSSVNDNGSEEAAAKNNSTNSLALKDNGGVIKDGNDVGDAYFKEMTAPSAIAHRPTWADNPEIEANPW